jgi:hypothetical protein
MVGDLVTTEAPPLAGLAARRRLLARLRFTGTLAYKLATTTDHKVIGIMYLVASCMRGMTAVDASSCGRLAQVPDGSHSSVRPPSPHESLENMVLAVLSAPGGALLLAGARR